MRRVVMGGIASLLVACSLITSFDGIEPRGAVLAADADADAVVPDAGCTLARWPAPPTDSDPAGDVGELVSAVTILRVLDPATAGKVQGFDLDGLCTCPDRAACVGARPNAPCDPEGGVDDVGESLFETLAGQGVSLDDRGLRTGITAGQYGLVVRITGYSGDVDDPSVKVAFFNAVSVNGDGGVPREDGTDRWTVDEESLLDQQFPAYFSTSAYVVGGVLVAALPRLVLRARIPTGPTTFSLLELDVRSAYLVARLGARSGSGIALDEGLIAGRIPASALLAQGMRSGACLDSGVYQALKPVVCATRDLPDDPSQDGRDLPCKSLSVGFGFTASAAALASGSGTREDTFPCAVVPDDCP